MSGGAHPAGRVASRRRSPPSRPPWLAQLLLRLALPAGLTRESVLGDFHEDYGRRRARPGGRARWWYWREAAGVGARALRARLRRRRAAVAGSAPDAATFTAGPPGWSPDRRPTLPRRVLAHLETAIARDVPYAVRNLRQAPGFTAVAVASLALGIAPLAAIGGFVNGLFLRPPDQVVAPDGLVALFRAVGAPISWPDLVDVAEQADGLEMVAAFNTHNGFNLTDGELTRGLTGAEVSSNYFDVLGTPPALGRGFAAAEMGDGAEPVAVVSHTFWQRDLGGDAEVLGRVLRLNGRDHTIIGVAPEGLLALEVPVEPQVYVTLRPEEVDGRGIRGIFGVGRLRAGVSLADVRAQLDVVQERLRAAYPQLWRDEAGRQDAYGVHPLRALRLRPGQEVSVAAGVGLIALLGVLVLTTACANLGNLLLARGWQRGSEIAVRLALGADRSTLVTMLLTESVLLGCAGGCAGGVVATVAMRLLIRALEAGLMGTSVRVHLGIDARVLAFAAFVSIATGVLFGLVPALRTSRPDLAAALKGGRSAGRARALSFRNLLVAGQVAASLALLVSAGVLLRSLQAMQRVDPGFDPEGVLTVLVDLSQRPYSDTERRQFFDQLAARVAGAPGVASVALAVDLPLDGNTWMSTADPVGVELPEGDSVVARENRVSEDYFELMHMPVVRGRAFTAADRAGSTPLVLVNEAFERRFWPAGALGHHLDTGGEPALVIGVVRDAKYDSLAESPAPIHFWRPFSADSQPAANLLVRTTADPRLLVATIRRLVDEADADLPLLEPRLLSDIVAASAEEQRVASVLLALVGVVSLALAVVGIYGVLSFIVSQRTREVGVRVALGARRGDVLRLVLQQAMRMVLAGAVVGLALAFGIAQVLAAAFAGVEPLDPVAPGAALLLLAVCAALAALLPALRASRVDPLVALRAE